MFFLLVVLLIGGQEEARTIGIYSDVQTCVEKGKTVKNTLRFKCVPIQTANAWRSI